MPIQKEDLSLLKQCNSKEEAIELIKKHHMLNDDELNSVNGGDFFDDLWEKIKEKTKEIVEEENPNKLR